MTRYKLMIPGPVDIEDDVLAEMAQPVMPHYGDDWLEIYEETIALAKQVFGTEHDLFIVPGPGTAGLDMAMGSMLASGEKILVCANGFFSIRMSEVARSYNLKPIMAKVASGQPITPEIVAARLSADAEIKAVIVVHHETSTGVLSPLQEIAEVTRKHNVPIIVDAVSSLGGVPLPVDEWGIDMCVTSSNKCLGNPPGFALVSVSPRAWEMVDARPQRGHGWYLNLAVWREYATEWNTWHPTPITISSNNFITLRASLRKLIAEGLENHYAFQREVAEWMRAELRALGCELFVEGEYACPLVTVIKSLPVKNAELNELKAFLHDEYAILIGGGIRELAGKILRIGHIGKAASLEYRLYFLHAVRDFLRRKGTGS